MSFDERLTKLERAVKPKIRPTGQGRAWINRVIKQAGIKRLPQESIIDAYCRTIGITTAEFKQKLRKKAGC